MTIAPTGPLYVLAEDAVLMWDVGRRSRVLVRATTGEKLSLDSSSPLPVVAHFFHTARPRSDIEPLLAALPGGREAFEMLVRHSFLRPVKESPVLRWDQPDPIDMALHTKAGWCGDEERHGREIWQRLAQEPPRTKTNSDVPSVPLPPPSPISLRLDRALASRRSHRRFADSGVSAQQLSTLLGHAAGLHGYLDAEPFADVLARPFPSGGGRHPLELFVLVRRPAPGVVPGIFHWNIVSNALARIGSPLDPATEIHLFADRTYCLEASVWLLFSAILARRAFKYERTVMRNILVEMGALVQNLYLVATAIGLAGCPFDVRRTPMEDFLNLDPVREPLLQGFAVGYPLDYVACHRKPLRRPASETDK